MRELRDIVDCDAEARRDGRRTALATVVRTAGSTYRRPGARMLITDGGGWTGCISGGCLEGDVVDHGMQVLESGVPRFASYDSTSDNDILWGYGSGCRGTIDVFIEPLDGAGLDPLAFIAKWMERQEEGGIATVFRVEENPIARNSCAARPGSRLIVDCDGRIVSDIADSRLGDAILVDVRAANGGPAFPMSYETAAGRVDVLVERFEPPLSLIAFGAGHEAPALARLARELGWHFTLVEHRPANIERVRGQGLDAVIAARASDVASASLTPRTAAVVMSHNYLDDLEALRVVLPSLVGYVGILGPRRRTEQLRDDLRAEGAPATGDEARRIFAPVGLDIGADGPEQIALAIVAEIQAVFAARLGGASRDRTGPLHVRDDAVSAASPHFEVADRPACILR